MTKLDFLDIGVIVIYMLAMLGIGAYFMRRQKSASEFLLAGRTVGWFAIGFSLLSSLNSAADYVIGPAGNIQIGFLCLVGIIPTFLSFPLIFNKFIPFYQRLRLYNCYEYLEHRFDLRVRLTATFFFIVWRLLWMGMTIYLPAFVLHDIMGLPLFPSILVLGAITTLYTALGGVRSVVWTDVVQAFVMLGGLLLATWIVIAKVDGGFAQVWAVSKESGFMRFTADIPEMASATSLWGKISAYFHKPVTFWGVIMGGLLWKWTNYGADHVMVQRYLSAKSLKDCKDGFVVNTIAYVVYSLLFLLLSMGLFVFFKVTPLEDATKYEYVFPLFIDEYMPPVITGLVLAAIYSAAQSSVSAGVAATTGTVFTDIYLRLFRGQVRVDEAVSEEIQRHHVAFSRTCACIMGTLVTLVACLISLLHANDTLFGLFNKIIGGFGGLLIPVFLLGMFTRRTRSLGVCVGLVCGFVATYYWGFHTDLGFGWTSSVAFVVTSIVAYVVSLFEKAPPPEKLEYLWKNIMARPAPDEAAAQQSIAQ